MICADNQRLRTLSHSCNDSFDDFILSTLSPYVSQVDEFCELRLQNYNYLVNGLQAIGIKPYFHFEGGIVPGVFLFRWFEDIDFPALKIFMNENGVESSVFYGDHAYFIPVHHRLTKAELDYMIALLEYFYFKIYRKQAL